MANATGVTPTQSLPAAQHPASENAEAVKAPVSLATSVELSSPKFDQDSLQIPLTPKSQEPSEANSPSVSANVGALSRQNNTSGSNTSNSNISTSAPVNSNISMSVPVNSNISMSAPVTGIQRRAAGTPFASAGVALPSAPSQTPTITKENIKSLGQAPAPKQHMVSSDVRAAVSAVAGVSPTSVTLHRGAAVDKRAQALNADAFTHEGAIHIPGTSPLISDKSRQILAHELTHVVQQQQYGKTLPPEHTPLGRQLEASAMHAETLVSSSPAKPSTAATSSVSMTPARREGSTNTSGAIGSQEIALTPGQSQINEVELSPRRLTTMAAPNALGSTIGNQPTWAGRSYSGETYGNQGPARPFGAAPVAPAGQPSGSEQVQRRSRAQSTQQSSESAQSPAVKPRAEAAPRVEAAATQQPTIFTNDARWLEQHANALYPLIRNMLRADLLKDRERRSKLMREY
jgi:hypothetical protein